MATLKDFVVNRGLVVTTTATVNGVDVLANDWATLQTALANDSATLASARANDYATYTTLNGRINTVQDNVGSIVANYSANDYATYLAAMSNDGVTLTSAYANDYTTYLAAQSNDYATLLAAQSNDYATLQTALANDSATLGAALANDGVTLASAYANDYVTLQAAQANDWATLQTALANDGATLASARANDYATYTILANEYQANDYTTYTTLLAGYRANDYATWSGLNSYVNIKANSATTISAGDGLTGGGDLTTNRTLAVDSTVVRTSGDQTINGTKTFGDSVIIVGDLLVEGNTTTIGTTSLLVEDKFIELASNTTGAPVGDVGIYLNRGNEGNSAIYYDQSGGYFAVAHTNDPATNTEVSPTSYAAFKVDTILVSNTSVVTNLNADKLDGQDGAYYLDFANATNTNLITLDRVLANGNSSTASIVVGGLTVDSNTLHVDSTNNFVGVRTLTPLAPLQVEVAGFDTSTVVTSDASANQILDTFATANFRTAKYMVQVHDTANNDYHTSEILLIHDGSTVYMTEYAIVYTDGALASFNADISGGSVRLLVSPVNTTNTIRVVRTTLIV